MCKSMQVRLPVFPDPPGMLMSAMRAVGSCCIQESEAAAQLLGGCWRQLVHVSKMGQGLLKGSDIRLYINDRSMAVTSQKQAARADPRLHPLNSAWTVKGCHYLSAAGRARPRHPNSWLAAGWQAQLIYGC